MSRRAHSVPLGASEEPTLYNIDEHRHRFAIWAAARAAQRNLKGGSVAALGRALQESGVREAVRSDVPWHPSAAEFDRSHLQWSDAVLQHLNKAKVEEASFGRAAKLIAIYLKTTIIISGAENTPLGRVIHPPVDSILLKAMAKDQSFDPASRKFWSQISWTKLDRNTYVKLIASLRSAAATLPAFWMLERYWDGARD